MWVGECASLSQDGITEIVSEGLKEEALAGKAKVG